MLVAIRVHPRESVCIRVKFSFLNSKLVGCIGKEISRG
jgi:hypothetical protein